MNNPTSDVPIRATGSGSTLASDSLTLIRVYLQTGAYPAAIDSCERLLQQTPDQYEVKILLAEAHRLAGRLTESDRIFQTLGEPEDAALKLQRCLLKARILYEKGLYRECIEQCAATAERSVAIPENILLGGVLGQCHARLKDQQTAATWFEWMIGQSERINWEEGIANGLMSLALVDRIVGHWTRADGLILKAREIYSRLGLSRQYIQSTLNLGVQRIWRGHLSFAEEALREAIRLSAETGDRAAETSARTDRGLALLRLGRTEEARRELARALRLSRRQASPRRLALALEYTGELHTASGNYSRASHALRRALEIANRIAPDGDIVPEVKRRQAEVAYGLGHHAEALETAKDAEVRAARLGDRYERATALRVQAQALRILQREDEAVKLLRDGLQILEELGETFERDRFLYLLGELLPAEEAETVAADAAIAQIEPEHAPETPPSSRKGFPTNKEVRAVLDEFGFIGRSRAVMDLMRQANQVARLDLPVLIQGETGTGKELLAHVIHKWGRPAKAPLIAFNCATCPADLLDAELFGHARGAYTGAHSNRLGLVRSAEGGTLFLDEIGEMREESQARLLRLLDSGEVRPLGTDQSLRVKVRIIAATHVDLEERIRERRFRRDLYFRLAGVRLILPPLRDRPGDLRDLVKAFVEEARKSVCPGFAGFSERVLRLMERYSWPGNIRQLKHEILRVAALAPEGVPVDSWTPAEGGEAAQGMLDPAEALSILEDPKRLRQLLQENGGQMVEVARVLGVSRGHLYRVLKRLGINVQDVRATPPGAAGRARDR